MPIQLGRYLLISELADIPLVLQERKRNAAYAVRRYSEKDPNPRLTNDHVRTFSSVIRFCHGMRWEDGCPCCLCMYVYMYKGWVLITNFKYEYHVLDTQTVATASSVKYANIVYGKHEAGPQDGQSSLQIRMMPLLLVFWCCGGHCGWHVTYRRMVQNAEYSLYELANMMLLYREEECNMHTLKSPSATTASKSRCSFL
jgi:hypothetical protein